MFCICFGWRKASKCKKLIKQLQYRLKLLKNKRSSIVKLLREDMAQLIQIRDEEKALNWAEQLFKEESTMEVYELLDNFCERIGSNMSYIRKQRDCPNDINEAVSSLIFASSRCGDLPELRQIRKLFEERYGQSFASVAAELSPGNLVNRQIKEKLCMKSVPDDVKHQLMDEIARDCCRQHEILAIEYSSNLQQVQTNRKHHELDKDVYTCYSRSDGCQTETSDANKMQDIHVDSVLTSKTKSTGLNVSHSPQNSDAVSTSICSSVVQQFSPETFESPEYNKAGKARNSAQFESPFESKVAGDHAGSGRINTDNKEHREERITVMSSSESFPQFDEEQVVYLDDIEEFQPSMIKDGDCQDQRLFKFKPSVQPKTKTVESYIDEYESWSEKSSSRSSRKSVNASGKQSRRRSLSGENLNIKDIECEMYYQKPRKSSASKDRSHHRREHPKMNPVAESKQSCYAEKGLAGITKPVKLPIYDLECADFGDHFGHYNFSHNSKSEEIEKPTLPQKPRRRSYNSGATEYDVFTYPYRQPNEQIQKTQGKAERFDYPSGCAAANRLTPKDTTRIHVPAYLTVKSMPPERPQESHTANILRSNSLPSQYPEHVHPKLPDYDDIASKFAALKKEHLQNRQ